MGDCEFVVAGDGTEEGLPVETDEGLLVGTTEGNSVG